MGISDKGTTLPSCYLVILLSCYLVIL
ncbi:hypothetical protein AZZ71_005398, partial [Klebsiella pneumoniae]